MPAPSRNRPKKRALDRAYLFQKLSETPFQGLNHLKQSQQLLRKAASRYIQSIPKESRTTLQEVMLDDLKREGDKPLSVKTLQNHLTELQKRNTIGNFQEQTYLCLLYAAKQLKAEGVWDIDVEKLKVSETNAELSLSFASNRTAMSGSNGQASNSTDVFETDNPTAQPPKPAFRIIGYDFHFHFPELSATMPESQYPLSLYERSNSLGRFAIGAFFVSLASLSVIIFYLLGASSSTLSWAFGVLSFMNFWTGWFAWYGDYQYHPQFTEIGRRFFYNLFQNSHSARQSFVFVVYSESLLIFVFSVIMSLRSAR